MSSFPFYKQHDTMDCGPTCLRMVAKYYGKYFSLDRIKAISFVNRSGVSLSDLSDAAEQIGFRTTAARLTLEELAQDITLPVIAHWKQTHFVVVYKIGKNHVIIGDPGFGILKLSREEFVQGWISTQQNNSKEGIVLALDTTPDFYAIEGEAIDKKKFSYLFSYLRPYKKLIYQLILGLLTGTALQLIFPFLTQAIVDTGIKNKDIDFITIMLVGQLVLVVSRSSVEFIRGWIFLHIGSRINIKLISDFLIKLMKLPISFFDSKIVGDLLQRIDDHKRIEQLLTANALSTLFSAINLLTFGVVLMIFSMKIFLIFLAASILYVVYVLFFLKKRRELDYKFFGQMSKNQSSLIQTLQGMQEIKLYNAERKKRWEWERIQIALFKVKIQSLKLMQFQEAGAILINEVKNIAITFLAAKLVIQGELTLGVMISIQYILGQLNAPINQFIGFIQTAQSAKISLERLGEIHDKPNEEFEDSENSQVEIPEDLSLEVSHLSFKYGGESADLVLDDVSFSIPAGKVTAIVGSSGSGKTTLIKLLLKFFPPTKGEIKLAGKNLNAYNSKKWRAVCGVVMQDGFRFSDTIANNIALGDEHIDHDRLLSAVKIANIYDFIKMLPLGFNTKIGPEGVGLSGGQQQRLLIARAVYKNPEILFFDEATNSLDSENEKVITQKLESFYENRTVVVVAHRLSTVRNADQIIVLEKGKLAEMGTHFELIEKEGIYFNLVRNQLELEH